MPGHADEEDKLGERNVHRQVSGRTWRGLAKRSSNYRILIIRVNPNNPWLKNTDLTDLTDFRQESFS